MPVTDVRGARVKKKSAPPLKMLFSLPGVLPLMNRYNHISTARYIENFKDPGIRELLGMVVGQPDYSAASLLFTLGGLAVNDCGYPRGGSLRMAQNMADTFTGLGGVIEYNARVEQVAVRDGRAVGAVLDGDMREADAVIVTSDTLTAADRLFEKPLHEPWMDEMRRETSPLNCTFLSLGIRADLSGLPENMVIPLKQPLKINNRTCRSLCINNYARFEGYAPAGCTAVTCPISLEDDYDDWKAAGEDGAYEEKKRGLAETVIGALAQIFPQTAGKVEVWDVATPLTYERYCGTYRGSWMSVLKPDCRRQTYPSKPDSVENLYFAGQRICLPGGLPVAVTTGRTAVQYLCRDAGEIFQGACE